jgi:hypothetical protein
MKATGGTGGGDSAGRMMGKAEIERKLKQYILVEGEVLVSGDGKKIVLLCAAAAVIYFAVFIGIFCEIEKWTFVDSFYFCVVTITTVG